MAKTTTGTSLRRWKQDGAHSIKRAMVRIVVLRISGEGSCVNGYIFDACCVNSGALLFSLFSEMNDANTDKAWNRYFQS
ncbi:hypothetical protein QTN25_002647 [Entamoeba marina]